MGWNLVGSLVQISLSVVLTLLIVAVATHLWVGPKLKVLKDAEVAIRTGMSAMGEKSGEVRGLKGLEQDIFSDLLDEYPELTAFLDIVSPETAEKIRENPVMAAKLIERYGPLIERFTGRNFTSEKKELVYNF